MKVRKFVMTLAAICAAVAIVGCALPAWAAGGDRSQEVSPTGVLQWKPLLGGLVRAQTVTIAHRIALANRTSLAEPESERFGPAVSSESRRVAITRSQVARKQAAIDRLKRTPEGRRLFQQFEQASQAWLSRRPEQIQRGRWGWIPYSSGAAEPTLFIFHGSKNTKGALSEDVTPLNDGATIDNSVARATASLNWDSAAIFISSRSGPGGRVLHLRAETLEVRLAKMIGQATAQLWGFYSSRETAEVPMTVRRIITTEHDVLSYGPVIRTVQQFDLLLHGGHLELAALWQARAIDGRRIRFPLVDSLLDGVHTELERRGGRAQHLAERLSSAMGVEALRDAWASDLLREVTTTVASRLRVSRDSLVHGAAFLSDPPRLVKIAEQLGGNLSPVVGMVATHNPGHDLGRLTTSIAIPEHAWPYGDRMLQSARFGVTGATRVALRTSMRVTPVSSDLFDERLERLRAVSHEQKNALAVDAIRGLDVSRRPLEVSQEMFRIAIENISSSAASGAPDSASAADPDGESASKRPRLDSCLS